MAYKKFANILKRLFLPEGVEVIVKFNNKSENLFIRQKPIAGMPSNVKARLNFGFFQFSNVDDSEKVEGVDGEVTLRVGYNDSEITDYPNLVLYNDSGEELKRYPGDGDLRMYPESWHGFDGYGEITVDDFPDPNIGWAS